MFLNIPYAVGMFEAEMSSDAFLLLGMAQRGFLPARLAGRSRRGTPGLAIALSSTGILLLVPRTRFAAGVMQLPITIGIVAFNATMFPRGVALAIGMLVVNLCVVLQPRDLRRLLAPSAN